MSRAVAPNDRNSFLVSLLDISRTTFGGDDLRAPAQRLLELTVEATDFGGGCVYLYDRARAVLRPLAWHGTGYGLAPQAIPLDADTPAARVAIIGQPVSQSSETGDARQAGGAIAYARLVLPLQVSGHVVGVLDLSGGQPAVLAPTDLDLVRLAANQIAVMIENARLYEQARAERTKMRAVVDACADGILVVDANCRVVDANPALERLLGIGAQELLGHTCTYLLQACEPGGNSLCDVYCPIRLQQQPPAGEVEACLPSKGGERWVGITYGILTDGAGNFSGVVHTIRDISAHKSAERGIVESGRRAEEERRRLQAIIDHLPEGVCIAEAAHGRIVLANRKARELLGRPECLLTGCGEAETSVRVSAASGAPFPAEQLPLLRSLHGEVCEGVQLAVTHADGRQATMLVNSAPLLDGEGAVSGAVAAFQDISALKEVERMKDSFVAAASHELRTPITSIRGYAQLLLRRLEREGERPDDVKATQVILRQVDRLVWLVNQLLDASRAQKGELALVLAPLDLRALTAEVMDRKRMLSDRHNLNLHAEGPITVVADAARIEQVLVNLLNNAIEYSPKGGAVDVRITEQRGRAIVAVEDKGIGISAERLKGIFERFYCAHSEVPRSNGGLGLGLYVSFQIVTRHGGSMWVESKEGAGSTFFFALPMAERPQDDLTSEERT